MLESNKMIDRIGSLTPLLLITIVAMIIKGFVDFSGHSFKLRNDKCLSFNLSGFSQGFTQGYLTMDAIASIAFSMIVAMRLKQEYSMLIKSLNRPLLLVSSLQSH